MSEAQQMSEEQYQKLLEEYTQKQYAKDDEIRKTLGLPLVSRAPAERPPPPPKTQARTAQNHMQRHTWDTSNWFRKPGGGKPRKSRKPIKSRKPRKPRKSRKSRKRK